MILENQRLILTFGFLQCFMIWLNRLHSLRPWLDSEYGYEHEAMYILTLRLCLTYV